MLLQVEFLQAQLSTQRLIINETADKVSGHRSLSAISAQMMMKQNIYTSVLTWQRLTLRTKLNTIDLSELIT